MFRVGSGGRLLTQDAFSDLWLDGCERNTNKRYLARVMWRHVRSSYVRASGPRADIRSFARCAEHLD